MRNMRTKAKFPDAGEMAAHYAAEEAPLCPACDCPLEIEYDWENKTYYCPACRENEESNNNEH
jgi:hypothetical protein